MTQLIRITKIDAKEGMLLTVGFEAQDGEDWFPQSKTLTEYPTEIDQHMESLKHISDRVFGTEFIEPNVLQVELTYYKPTKKNPNPNPAELQEVNVVTEVGTPGGKKGSQKLKVNQYYSAEGAGEYRYLKSSECIAIESICNLLSNAIAEQANKGPVFKPVQMSLGI